VTANASPASRVHAHATISRVCILVCMTRVNIYLPDDLAVRARERELNISALAQAAITAELTHQATAEWLAEIPVHDDRHALDHQAAMTALDSARDELGW